MNKSVIHLSTSIPFIFAESLSAIISPGHSLHFVVRHHLIYRVPFQMLVFHKLFGVSCGERCVIRS